MTKTEKARLLFWEGLKSRLVYFGNPFSIIESAKQWAVVNRADTNFRKTGFFIDYLYKYKIIRMGLYIPDNTKLYDDLLKVQKEINNKLIFDSVMWKDKGPVSESIRWIKREIPISNNIEDDIDEVIRTMSNFVEVLNQYLPIKFIKINS